MTRIDMPWYTRESYPQVLQTMSDSEIFPRTFDEWHRLAKHAEANFHQQGYSVHRAHIDPKHFAMWCSQEGHDADAKARSAWSNAPDVKDDDGAA